jgi:hypothetical protein
MDKIIGQEITVQAAMITKHIEHDQHKEDSQVTTQKSAKMYRQRFSSRSLVF